MVSKISSINDWILDVIVDLDRHHAGFAGSYLRASDERRQVIAAALAQVEWTTDEASQSGRAEFLLRANHRSVLASAFPTLPVGLRGALRRVGPQAQPRPFYGQLHQLLAQPPHSAAPRTLTQLATIDERRVSILQRLPAELCSPAFVEAVEDVEAVDDILKCIDLLVDRGVDRNDLITALACVSTPRAMVNCWRRWVRRASFPPHPVPASATYRPVSTAAELTDLARRYRNCAERYITTTLEGVDHFAEYELEGRKVVVHLRKHNEVWCLEDLFGKLNRRPSASVRIAAMGHLMAHGVRPKAKRHPQHGDWQILRRLSQSQVFDLDDF